MRKLNPFLVSLLLLSTVAVHVSSENESIGAIKAPIVVIVTDEVIGTICRQTSDCSLCENILVQFKGKTLFPKPLTKVMWQVRDQAKTAAKKIVLAYDAFKGNHSYHAVLDAYRACVTDYETALKMLAKAEKSVQIAKIKPAVEFARNATSAVRACDRELRVAGRASPDNKKFLDLSGIFLVMCGRLKTGVRVNLVINKL